MRDVEWQSGQEREDTSVSISSRTNRSCLFAAWSLTWACVFAGLHNSLYPPVHLTKTAFSFYLMYLFKVLRWFPVLSESLGSECLSPTSSVALLEGSLVFFQWTLGLSSPSYSLDTTESQCQYSVFIVPSGLWMVLMWDLWIFFYLIEKSKLDWKRPCMLNKLPNRGF